MLENIKKDLTSRLVISFYIFLTIWWIVIYIGGTKTATVNYLYGGVYGAMSLIGGIVGIKISRQWGGTSSIMGRAIIAFALGLFFQAFGQYVFWFYNFFLHIEIPYPSIADIGYFGSIPFYSYGVILLAKASGVQLSLRKLNGQLLAILIPLTLLIISYLLFLQKYEYDLQNPIKVFLDIGYPLGQATYISLAILTYSLTRNTLGGLMKNRILLLLIALATQYLADFSFLYFQTEYYNASFIDYIYLVAYLVMSLGLLQLKITALRLHQVEK